MKKIPALIKRSLQYSFAIITFINTVAGVIGFTIRDFSDKLTWWHCLIILIAAYAVITIPIFFGLRAYQHRSYKTKINGYDITNIYNGPTGEIVPPNTMVSGSALGAATTNSNRGNFSVLFLLILGFVGLLFRKEANN